jgi:4-carboxymuconolactone decarboxylase
MARIPDGAASDDPAVEELYERLAGKRGHVGWMYRSLLNAPEVTERVSALGTYLRFESSELPPEAREAVILATAAELGAAYEWAQHAPIAREAGVSAEAVNALRAGRRPTGVSPAADIALRIASDVLAQRSIGESTRDKAISVLGLAGLVETVVLVGFYAMIAGVVRSFDIEEAAGTPDVFGGRPRLAAGATRRPLDDRPAG